MSPFRHGHPGVDSSFCLVFFTLVVQREICMRLPIIHLCIRPLSGSPAKRAATVGIHLPPAKLGSPCSNESFCPTRFYAQASSHPTVPASPRLYPRPPHFRRFSRGATSTSKSRFPTSNRSPTDRFPTLHDLDPLTLLETEVPFWGKTTQI